MDFRDIIEWLSELKLEDNHLKELTSISLHMSKDGYINCGMYSPEFFLLNEKVLEGRSENSIYKLLTLLDQKNCIVYEAKKAGHKVNRLTILI